MPNTQFPGSRDDRPKDDGRRDYINQGGGKATKLTWIAIGIVAVVLVYAVVSSL